MEAKHVVITGGASGLGLGCARQFRRLGWRVTIADLDAAAAQRAVAALDPAGQGAARAEAVDLARPDSIADFAQRLKARDEPIDVLVNNAGIYPPSRRLLSPEGHELAFAIAHFGHFRLTHALWPLLERADAARVVSISSLVQRSARLDLDDLACARRYEPIIAYQRAKLACLLFALELQRRLAAAGSAIGSYAAHPGVCRTQLGRNRRRSDDDSLWQRFATLMLSSGQRYIGQSPDSGAASVVVAATGSLPPGSFIGPRWFESFGTPVLSRPGMAASDASLAAALWAQTEAITGLRWTL